MKALILTIIRLYQNYRVLPVGSCRFFPTCSEYSYQQLAKYGILKGGFLSLKRILRCHPWSTGGYDPCKLSGNR